MTKKPDSQLGDRVFELVKNLGIVAYDFCDVLIRAFSTKTFPLAGCVWCSYILSVVHLMHWDQKLIPIFIVKSIAYKLSILFLPPFFSILPIRPFTFFRARSFAES